MGAQEIDREAPHVVIEHRQLVPRTFPRRNFVSSVPGDGTIERACEIGPACPHFVMNGIGADDGARAALFSPTQTHQPDNIDRIAVVLQVPVGQVTALALVLERTAKIDNVSEEMTASVLRAGRTDMGSDPQYIVAISANDRSSKGRPRKRTKPRP